MGSKLSVSFLSSPVHTSPGGLNRNVFNMGRMWSTSGGLALDRKWGEDTPSMYGGWEEGDAYGGQMQRLERGALRTWVSSPITASIFSVK